MFTMLEFDGCLDSVKLWHALVEKVTGIKCGKIIEFEEYGLEMGKFRANLTAKQRDQLQVHWGKVAKGVEGCLGNGMPYRWNDCIGYVECNPVLERRAQRISRAIERQCNGF